MISRGSPRRLRTPIIRQGGVKKPLLNVLMFGDFADELRRGLEDASLPTFDYPDTVARGAANLASYAAMRATAAKAPDIGPVGRRRRARRAIDPARGRGGPRQSTRA